MNVLSLISNGFLAPLAAENLGISCFVLDIAGACSDNGDGTLSAVGGWTNFPSLVPLVLGLSSPGIALGIGVSLDVCLPFQDMGPGGSGSGGSGGSGAGAVGNSAWCG